jgi:hypothetical protein
MEPSGSLSLGIIPEPYYKQSRVELYQRTNQNSEQRIPVFGLFACTVSSISSFAISSDE